MIPRLFLGGSELLAVPAVHNCAVFAGEVNQACQDAASRPEAIAVELSHDAVLAVVAWLKELGVGPGVVGNIPCMLGLVKANRRIHPSHKEAALRLQERHGVLLHQVPSEILRQQLNFAPVSLLCISITDSMIEAIRSALELEIPVYGIDLGEVANGERGQPMLLDPVLAQGGLASYVQRNEHCCAPHRDAVVDGRREQVMAARLKRLLQQYRRVLFTGGLGHWQQLRQRLSDPSLKPATEPVQSEEERFTRVVVAPALAIHQMDLLPDLTTRYEAIRRLPLGSAERLMDYAAIYRSRLAAACECAEPKHREAVAALAGFLANLALIHQRRVPDLFMTLAAARAMISPAFASRLGEMWVLKALPWAGPKDWPDLPYLCEVQASPDESRFPSSGRRAELQGRAGRSAPFYLTDLSDNEDRASGWLLPPLSLSGTGETGERMYSRSISSWVWPPCESLLYGTALEAAGILDRDRRELVPEPFSGSLHEGVDVKATLRALIRGERRVQIRARSAPNPMDRSGEGSGEPAVFIFQPEETVADGRWDTLLAGERSDIRKFVRDPARFDGVVQKKGDVFVASVHFGTSREPRAGLKCHVKDLLYLYGIVVFGNPCLNSLQAARWLEGSDYARCPILRRSGTENLFDHYRQEHNLSLHWERWAMSLIRLALPHAKRRVAVILPPSQRVPASVLREASARRIKLEFLPLSRFPKERIDAVRHQYLVYPNDADGLEYSAELQAAFGESPDAHLDLLPEPMRAQLEFKS